MEDYLYEIVTAGMQVSTSAGVGVRGQVVRFENDELVTPFQSLSLRPRLLRSRANSDNVEPHHDEHNERNNTVSRNPSTVYSEDWLKHAGDILAPSLRREISSIGSVPLDSRSRLPPRRSVLLPP